MLKKYFTPKHLSGWILGIFLIFFVILPTGYSVLTSFCVADDLGNITFDFTLSNYKKMFSHIYGEVIINSIKIALTTTTIVLVVAYPLAYIVSKMSRGLQLFTMFLIVLPYWTNSLVRTYSFMVILRADGFINKLLMNIGLISKPLQLLYTDWAVILTMVYLFLPIMFLPIYSSIEKLDKSYIEASEDLGASKFDTFTRVILPLSAPGIVAGSILVFTPCLGMFYISDLIGGGKTVLLGSVIRDQFTTTRNLPFGSALSVIMMIMALMFIVVYYKISSGGEDNEK